MVLFIRNIEKTTGKYDKFITKSELKNMSKIRKSIYASTTINKGDIFTSKNITTKRPDTYISASKWDKVIGKIASRNYNVDEAIQMLERAYKQKKDDPYIIDSIGWGYYIIGDFINAEKYLEQAVQLMPDDPIVNDHYGDVLWKLNRKLQAKYFWESVLNLETTEEEMKKNILGKLFKGPDKI